MEKRFIIPVFLLMLSVAALLGVTIYSISTTLTGETITGNATSASTSIAINFIAEDPVINLTRPENKTYLKSNNLKLNFTALYTNTIWYKLDSEDNVTVTGNTTFNTANGQHTLYLYANNSDGDMDSDSVIFTVNITRVTINYGDFGGAKKGNSTNFSNYAYEDLENLSGVILENTDYGKISFSEEVNLTNINDDEYSSNIINFSKHINISANHIEINSTALLGLNKSAALSLYGLSFDDPRILMDGVVCPDTICTGKSYNSGTGVLTFNVAHFTTFSSEETPSTPSTPSGTTSPGGGGGGSSGAATIVPWVDKISVSTEKMSLSLKQGQVLTKNIAIKNNQNQKVNVKIEEQKLSDFLIIRESEISLNSFESKVVPLDFIIREDTVPDLYLGKLLITSEGTEKEIFIAIEVESAEPLFDVKVKIPQQSRYVLPGETLHANTELFNLGTIGRLDVEVEYSIINKEGEIITKEHESVAIETQASVTKEIQIPRDIDYEDYILYVKVTYDGKVASASAEFEVTKDKISGREKIYIVMITFILIILSVVIYFLIENKRERIIRIKKKIGLKDLIKKR
ncbi:MAG: hypothetical protein ABIH49_02565 [archaeon]